MESTKYERVPHSLSEKWKKTTNLHFNGFFMSCVFVLMVISEIHKEGPMGVIIKRSFYSFKHTSNIVHFKRVKERKNMKDPD